MFDPESLTPRSFGAPDDYRWKPRHFVLSEFFRSRTANKKQIYNLPLNTERRDVFNNLERLALESLDPIRQELGRPVFITSGYRSPELNKAVGGVATSNHILGCAVDFVVPGVSALNVVNTVKDMLARGLKGFLFHRLINEYDEWLHIEHTGAPTNSIWKETRTSLKFDNEPRKFI